MRCNICRGDLRFLFCSQAYGKIQQDISSQWKELRLWFQINHKVTVCRQRTHGHSVNTSQTISEKANLLTTVEQLCGDDLGKDPWEEFCLGRLNVQAESSRPQYCCLYLVLSHSLKSRGVPWSFWQWWESNFNQSSLSLCQSQFSLNTWNSKLNSHH